MAVSPIRDSHEPQVNMRHLSQRGALVIHGARSRGPHSRYTQTYPSNESPLVMPGWSSAYVELHTLTGGHSDTVNSLSFSPDGVYLASCGDDQSLIVWKVEEGRLLYRVVFKSKVDRVLWNSNSPATIIVGCDNGYLYQLHDISPVSLDDVWLHSGLTFR